MPLAKCERCDSLFDKIKGPICASCMPDEDSDMEVVRNCLTDNPDVTKEKLAELSEVDVSVVKRMLDQDLISATLAGADVKCGRCGAPAISHSKKLCEHCLQDLNRGVIAQCIDIETTAKKPVQVAEFSSTREMLSKKRR